MSLYKTKLPKVNGKFATGDRKAFKQWTTAETLALGGTFKRYATLAEWSSLYTKLQAAEHESYVGDYERARDMSASAIIEARFAVEKRVAEKQGEPVPETQPETKPQQETETMTDLFTQTRETETKPQPVQQGQTGDMQTQINNLSQTLINVLGSMGQQQQQPQQVDEAQVIELIQKHAPATKIHVCRGDEVQREIPQQAHKSLETVIEWLEVDEDVYIVGPAGSGKTTLAAQAAEVLDLPFYFTARVDSAAKLLGYKDAKGDYQRTVFRDWCENGGIFLFDEIDASCPNSLTAFNQALANRECAFPDGIVKLHEDCKAIAAANTVGTGANRQYVGRNRLDGATLDRFVFIEVEYDEQIEKAMAGDQQEWFEIVKKYRSAADDLALAHIISPRATKAGAKLFSRYGSDRDGKTKLINQVICKGLPADQAMQLHMAAGVL